MNAALPIAQRQLAPAVVIPPDAWFRHIPPFMPAQYPFIVPDDRRGERFSMPLQCGVRLPHSLTQESAQ